MKLQKKNYMLKLKVMSFFTCLILIMLFTVLSITNAAENSTSLTLKDILNITLENNPDIKAAASRMSGSLANVEGSGKWTNPELLIGSNFGSIDDKDNITLSQTFDISGKFSLKRSKAEEESLYVRAGLEETILEISLQTKLKYYDYCSSVQELKLQEKNTEIFRDTIKNAEMQYNLGNIPQADLLRLELEQGKVEQALIHIENQVKLAKSEMFRIMGVNGKDDVEIIVPPLEINKIVDFKLEDLLTLAMEKRPVIEGEKALIQSKVYDLKIAKRNRYPDLIVSYKKDRFTSDAPSGAEIRLAFPLWDYGSIGSQADMAEASQKEEEALFDSVKSRIELEVKSTYYELNESSYLLDLFRDKLLSHSDELLRKAQYGYQEGAFSYLDFIDALKTYNDTQSEYIKTYYDYYRSIAKCERATGASIGQEEDNL